MKKWNYEKPSEATLATQEDWNQTLNTLLNSTLRIENNSNAEIIVPIKFKPLIETLVFYKKNYLTRPNNEKVKVDFLDKNEDVIVVGKSTIEIINYN